MQENWINNRNNRGIWKGCQIQNQFPKNQYYSLAIIENKMSFIVAAERAKYPGIILANNI